MIWFSSFVFCIFLGAVFGLARAGFDESGHFKRAGWLWLAGTLAALILWVCLLKSAPPPYDLQNLRRFELPKRAAF